MYNEDLKNRFINDYTTSIEKIKMVKTLFGKTKPFEEKAGKDICTFSGDELTEISDAILGMRSSSRRALLCTLRGYFKWCIERNVEDVCDDIFRLKFEKTNVAALGNKTVCSPKELADYLDLVFEPISDCTIHNVHRCALWLAYMGVAEKDLISIKEKDVDLLRKTFLYNGVKIPIYAEALPTFSILIGCQQFRHRHPKYTVISWRPKCEGDELIRGIKPLSATAISDVYSRHLSKLKSDIPLKSLSYRDIWMSGLYYKQHMLELAGVDPIPQNAVLLEPQYGNDKKSNTVSNRITCFFNDYFAWKACYDL